MINRGSKIELLSTLRLLTLVMLCVLATGRAFAVQVIPGDENFQWLRIMVGQRDKPNSTLVQDSAGNLYGTATRVYPNSLHEPQNNSVVYKITQNGAYRVLHRFSGINANQIISVSHSGLVIGKDGSLYGTTIKKAAKQIPGTPPNPILQNELYKIDSNGNYSVVHTFGNGDEVYSIAKLAYAQDGTIYGILKPIDPNNFHPTMLGKIFKINPDGAYSTVLTFDGSNGSNPESLTVGSDGSVYGVTSRSSRTFAIPGCNHLCTSYYGTVFKVDIDSNFKVLHFLMARWEHRHPPNLF